MEAQTSYGQYADTINMATYNHTRIQGTNYCWSWIHLPGDSLAVTGKHPLIIFLHGAGQTGNGQAGLASLTSSQDAYMPYLINQSGTNPVDSFNFVNVVTGLTDKPFGVSPQASTSSGWGIFSYQLDSIIGDLIWHKFPGLIDTNRIYITGLSAGGEGAWDWIAHWNSVSNVVYTSRYKAAAIFIQSAVINTNGQEYTNYPIPIADSVFVAGAGDSLQDLHGIQTAKVIDAFHIYASGAAAYLAPAFIQYHGTSGGGHCCWLAQWQPTFSMSWSIRGNNYTGNAPQFLLSHSRVGLVPGEVVTVNAGANQTLSAGTTSALLSATAVTNKTFIVRYQWSQISGPTVTMLNPFSDTTTILGLTNGNSYTFQAFANNADSVSGTANTTVTVSNPTGQRIFANPYTVYYNSSATYDTPFLALNFLSRDTVGQYLFNQQHQVDPINSPSLVPTAFPGVSVNPQEFYPLTYVYDFGGMFQLTDVFFYDDFGSDSIYFYTGNENNWVLYYAGITSAFKVWTHLNSSLPTTRFFKVILKSSQSVIDQICFYGIQQGSVLSTTPQHPKQYHFPTLDSLSGQCYDGQPFIPYPMLVGQGLNGRGFENVKWMDTNSVVHALPNLRFNFDVYSPPGNITKYYWPTIAAGLHLYTFQPNSFVNSFNGSDSVGQTNLWYSIQGNADALNNYNGWNGFYPIDSVNHPGYRDSSIAGNYDRQGRLFYLYGRLLGNGSGSTGLSQILYPTGISNLNLAKWMELGNEIDADGVTPFWKAVAFYAYTSEGYDGNGSAPSSLIGFHNADTTLLHMNPGFYYMDSSLLKGLLYFSYWRRPDHKWYFNGINFHYYPFSSPNHSISRALAPEEDSTRSKFTTFVNWCHTIAPGEPVILSEYSPGDRNRSSPLHVPIVAGVDSATVQAWLSIRFKFAIMASGISFSTQFQEQNDPQSNSARPNVNPLDTNALFLFNSTGINGFFQSPVDFSFQFLATPMYYYNISMHNLMGNYRYDSIVSESSTGAWAYRFRSTAHSDSLAIAVWSPTITNATISNVRVSVGTPNAPVRLVQFTNGSTTGNVTTATTDVNGYVTLNITENPVFIMYKGPSPANNCNCITHKHGAPIIYQ